MGVDPFDGDAAPTKKSASKTYIHSPLVLIGQNERRLNIPFILDSLAILLDACALHPVDVPILPIFTLPDLLRAACPSLNNSHLLSALVNRNLNISIGMILLIVEHAEPSQPHGSNLVHRSREFSSVSVSSFDKF